jgi:hypothetical protein
MVAYIGYLLSICVLQQGLEDENGRSQERFIHLAL